MTKFAITVATIEQFREVVTILGKTNLYTGSRHMEDAFDNDTQKGGTSCVYAPDGTHCSKSYFESINAEIISFGDFLEQQRINVGDWVVCTHPDDYFRKNDLFKVTRVYGSDPARLDFEKDSRGNKNGWCTKFFRKASPSEIAKQQGVVWIGFKEDNELVGYKLIKGYPGSGFIGAVVKVGEMSDLWGYPEFYEPVYKPKTVIFNIYPGFDVEIKDGKAWYEGREYDKKGLQFIVKDLGYAINGHTVEHEYVNIGCKKGVPIAKLKELISKLS
jgi:hypothetical protein